MTGAWAGVSRIEVLGELRPELVDRPDHVTRDRAEHAWAPYSPPSWCTRSVFVEPAVPGGVPATMTM